LTEPVAAATHYASLERRRLAPGTTVAVYDFGGATFDVALVEKTVDGFALRGRPIGQDIGGFDIDQILLDHVRHALGPDWPTDIEDEGVLTALTALRSAVVDRKEALSSDVEVTIPVFLPGLNRQVRLTRGEFEESIGPLVQQTVDMVETALADASLQHHQLDRLVIVGGSSRIPLVTQRLKEAFPRVPVFVDEHPKWAICLGAAIAAGARLPGASVAPPAAAEAVRSPSAALNPEPVVARPAAFPAAEAQGVPSYAVNLADRALSGVRDEIALRPAADLRRRTVSAVTSQVAAELGPAEPGRGTSVRTAVGVAVVALLLVAVIALIVLAARR
jgi:hypothetical protein